MTGALLDAETALTVVDYDPFACGELERVVVSTEPQREIWLADRLGREASLSFNLSVSLRLTGPLDKGALARVLASTRAEPTDATAVARLARRAGMRVERPEPLRLEIVVPA